MENDTTDACEVVKSVRFRVCACRLACHVCALLVLTP